MNAGRPQLSHRLAAIGESSTALVFAMAQQLRREGRDIIDLAVGEPEFDTPQPIIDATRSALTNQKTRYGPVAGIDPLRERLAAQFEDCTPENLIVTNGAKQALYSLFHVLCDAGDEIILPRPSWVSFAAQISIAGGIPKAVTTLGNHQLDIAAIEGAVSDKTKAILINSPNNPTGAVYGRQDLRAVASIAQRRGLYVVADEAYHAFTYDGAEHVSMAELAKDIGQVITVRSFSKQYNMTGFRLGYANASREIIAAMAKHQSHLCGNVCTFAQHGALAALKLNPDLVGERRQALARRRRLAFNLTADLFECSPPQGAFYLFPKVETHLRAGESSEAFALRLLDQCDVAVVPGEAFGQAGHIRISFGSPEEKINEAFQRIKRAL